MIVLSHNVQRLIVQFAGWDEQVVQDNRELQALEPLLQRFLQLGLALWW